MKEKPQVEPMVKHHAGKILSDVIDHISDYAMFIMDPDGVIVYWNKAAEVMKQYRADEAIGNFFGFLYTDEGRSAGEPLANLACAAEAGTFQEEGWRRKKDGSLFWALVEIIAVKGDDGHLAHFCKVTRDLTGQKELQQQLSHEKERAQVTLGAIAEAVISVDAEGNIDYLNRQAEHLTGWTDPDARGRALGEVFRVSDEETLEPQEHRLLALIKNDRVLAPNTPAVLTTKDGRRVAIEDTAAPIHLPKGGIIGGVIVFRDVTASRQLLKTVTYQATHDPLTGLANRRQFEKCLQRSLDRSRRSRVGGAVLFMDLDQFKIVNDTCGHEAGDELLRQIASLYRKEIRDRDALGRLGGDEFALIVDHCSRDEGLAIANKLLESTRAFEFVRDERVFKVGVSIGLATFDASISATQEVLALADRACYAAKANGKNQICIDHQAQADKAERSSEIEWVARLTAAMKSNRLTLHCQPIALATGNRPGLRYEVLLRMRDPHEGLILPDCFLPSAERYKLMPAVDRWVIEHVLQWLAAHLEHARQLELCSINLAADTLSDESFLPDLSALIALYGARSGTLCFEVSGGAAIVDLQKSLAAMHGLHALGCKVSLTGFGNGVASFKHLKQLPSDFVKIDASIVGAITTSVIDEKMVQSVNEIAHLLGKKTIAECVEDQATMELLASIGTDYLQGHWIACPQEFENLYQGRH
ncbi:EAL domain-containing protein [Massilia pseudoviolaceinigra]|uniref:EAL domain-containing protein n=1 Tax=Massilia pseudoviolaceinigra TaxID=3057165 RepID=UPI002796401A|nr:EAL domain-containing protein [Massilia sp. CCM 9206]MDQ1924396.1 EAL domain-containing protein [Massilia sp. CCM 9206]